jgi:hypothetical protein
MSHEPHLKLGDHGQYVEYVQNVMEQMGIPAGKHADGVFDQQTHDQVVAFQEHHSIHPVNGEVGEHTWAALGGLTVMNMEPDHVEGARTAHDMAAVRNMVIQIAKTRLEFHFHEVTRAAQDFHTHALSKAQMLTAKEAEPDVFAFFEAATSVFGWLFPEAELTKLVAELAVSAFKQAVEVTGRQAENAATKDILTLAERLAESTATSAQSALKAGEAALHGSEDPATLALQKLDHLPTIHEQEWLEYTVTHFLGIPDPVTHSPYLYVREPLEEKLAMAVARHEHVKKYGEPNTPFWEGQEKNHEIDAKVKTEIEYEHKGWHEQHPHQQHPHQQHQ